MYPILCLSVPAAPGQPVQGWQKAIRRKASNFTKKEKDMNEKGGKSRIVKDIMAKGFTARKSEKALNAVIDSLKFALRRGEPVEVPCGTLEAKVQSGRPRRKWQRFRNVNTGKTDFQYISYPGRRRVVKFKPDRCSFQKVSLIAS
jgi:nucleoid DNA-binding protein